MIKTDGDTYIFHLGHISYIRTGVMGWLVFNVFLLGSFASAFTAAWLLSTYSHAFTPYLKWQDMLVAVCWIIAFISIWGCVMVGRFLYALRIGYREGMATFTGGTTLTVRDLSCENLVSIFRMTATEITCFATALSGLLPLVLIGWTLHLPYPALAWLTTAAAIILGIAGLPVTAAVAVCIIFGYVGAVSFCRTMSAPQTYQLTAETTLMFDSSSLTIISPNKPESIIDLKLLATPDRRQLLRLLRKHCISAADMAILASDGEIEPEVKESRIEGLKILLATFFQGGTKSRKKFMKSAIDISSLR